jgi:hypothetical protein
VDNLPILCSEIELAQTRRQHMVVNIVKMRFSNLKLNLTYHVLLMGELVHGENGK